MGKRQHHHHHHHCHHFNKCFCGYCFDCGEYVRYQTYPRPWVYPQPYWSGPYWSSSGVQSSPNNNVVVGTADTTAIPTGTYSACSH